MNQVFNMEFGFWVAFLALIISMVRNWYMSRQMVLASLLKTVEWMEEIRPSRAILYQIRESNSSYNSWTDEQKEAAYKATRWFDILGVLESTGYIDRKVFDRFYAIPAYEIWLICKPYVDAERAKRGDQHLWEFEQLALRVQHVKDNHPAILNRRKWPFFPRMQRCRNRASAASS